MIIGLQKFFYMPAERQRVLAKFIGSREFAVLSLISLL